MYPECGNVKCKKKKNNKLRNVVLNAVNPGSEQLKRWKCETKPVHRHFGSLLLCFNVL